MSNQFSSVYEIRLHGRGGQGVVSAAAVLALAAFENGFQSQAFPKFGSERRGAPVEAYVRISNVPIRAHTQIYHPDVVIIQDVSLFKSLDVLVGLKASGKVIVNSGTAESTFTESTFTELTSPFSDAELKNDFLNIPASQLAQIHLGRPLPNMVLLGALAAISDFVDTASLTKAIEIHLGSKGDKVVQANTEALQAGYKTAVQELENITLL